MAVMLTVMKLLVTREVFKRNDLALCCKNREPRFKKQVVRLLPACLTAGLLACLLAYLPACMPACLPACLPAWRQGADVAQTWRQGLRLWILFI